MCCCLELSDQPAVLSLVSPTPLASFLGLQDSHLLRCPIGCDNFGPVCTSWAKHKGRDTRECSLHSESDQA